MNAQTEISSPDDSVLPDADARISTPHNLIIAGSNKCGTTSVFRYMSSHPSVCASRIKEACFFYSDPGGKKVDVLARYESLFSARDTRTRIFLEASPTYLHGGQKIAEKIHRSLPDARLLFVLRNPADRLVSYYKSQFGQAGSAVSTLEFREFVSRSILDSGDKTETADSETAAFRQEFTMARYADFLPGYFETYGPSQMMVTFFEDLKRDPQSFLKSVCDFIDVDSRFFEGFDFVPQNRTRRHRSSLVRRIGAGINARLEPFFNRMPGIRDWSRKVYNQLNTVPATEIPIETASYELVTDYYEQPNSELRHFMETNYPNQRLPKWLSITPGNSIS